MTVQETGEHRRFESGTIIAKRYEVVSRLGQGGMGIVLKVRDQKLNNQLAALKLLHPQLDGFDDAKALQRLVNEVIVARSLTHPNIVRIHDIGETEEGFTYFSMEYVDGLPLSDHLRHFDDKGLPFDKAVQTLWHIIQGISYAHSRGVIHRDLKPANVLVSSRGEILIADFGLARIHNSDFGITKTGEALGTPAYMAPEQFRTEPVDFRCDIYALGIIAYQIASGELPFNSTSFFDLAFKQINEPLPEIREKHPHIPEWFSQMLAKATEKNREQRYQSVDEMARILSAHYSDFGSTIQLSLPVPDAPRADAGDDMATFAEQLPQSSVYRLHSQGAVPQPAPQRELKLEPSIAQTVLAPGTQPAKKSNALIFGGGAAALVLAAAVAFFALKDGGKSPDPAATTANVAQPGAGSAKRDADRAELLASLGTAPEAEPTAAPPGSSQSVTPGSGASEPAAQANVQPAAATATETAAATVAEPVVVAKAVRPPAVKPPVTTPPAKKTVQPPPSLIDQPRDLYEGSFTPNNRSARALTLDIAIVDGRIAGTATIDSLGSFKVSGSEAARGVSLSLIGSVNKYTLTGAKKGRTAFTGTYYNESRSEQGSWKAELLE